jgi:cell division septation protein DedD
MFRSRFACQFAVFALLLASAEAQASSKPSDAELAAITARGVLLAEYDTAAWQATDAVTAAHPIESRANLYIARKTDPGWTVDFGRLNEAGDKFLLAYEAIQTCAFEQPT